MRLIVGLGNPGSGYANTRHSVGYLVLDKLQNTKLPKNVVLRKSDVFMNDSGSFVANQIKNLKLETKNLYVVHDDLDIPLGSYKIQFGKGPKDHNGVKSIDDTLGTSEYWHVRVGIDNRPLDGRPMGEEYVLQSFTDDERQILDEVIQRLCKELAKSLKSTN